jgi:hypothetical protein
MTAPHGARERRGTRGRRRRRSALRSLGRTRSDSTRPQLAQRTTATGLGNFGSLDSSERISSVRAASTAEDDGDEGIGAGDSSVEIASVTPPPRPARNRACRARPDARPPGDRPYTRLASRWPARRRSDAHGPHRARTDAHTPQNTKTRTQPPQRPNRPSTQLLPWEGLDSRGAGRHRDPRRARFRRARHEGSGDQTRAFTFSINPLLLRRRRPRWR